jgi:hypothetical protein
VLEWYFLLGQLQYWILQYRIICNNFGLVDKDHSPRQGLCNVTRHLLYCPPHIAPSHYPHHRLILPFLLQLKVYLVKQIPNYAKARAKELLCDCSRFYGSCHHPMLVSVQQLLILAALLLEPSINPQSQVQSPWSSESLLWELLPRVSNFQWGQRIPRTQRVLYFLLFRGSGGRP